MLTDFGMSFDLKKNGISDFKVRLGPQTGRSECLPPHTLFFVRR